MQLNNIEFVVDKIKTLNLPVVMYGTGNGAEKLYFELQNYGITVSDIFASDGFKAGKIFLGHTVLHLDEIRKKYKKFIIVLGFATDRSEMLDRVKLLKAENGGRLFMPEVPVFDNGFFTPELLKKRQDDIEKLFGLLADEQSKKVLEGIINFKLSGNIDKLFEIETEKAEVYKNILSLNQNETYVDAGAYNGDTVNEFLQYASSESSIIAIEPAPKNLEKLNAFAATIPSVNLKIIEGALSNTIGNVNLSDKSGRSPHIKKGGKVEVKSLTLDSLNLSPTFIKYDVEGAELSALEGSLHTILNFKPKLAISLYHRLEDFIDIPLFINNLVPEYKVYLRHHPYLPSWETNLYAII